MSVRPLRDCTLVWADSAGTERHAWLGGDLLLAGTGTHFAYVASGMARLVNPLGEFPVPSGCFFSLPGEGRLTGEGTALVVTRLGYAGMFYLGGPLEETGRLRYIDGCSDSVLIA